MPETTTYHLACHCQSHVIRIDLPKDAPFDSPGVCDCSHCLKRRIVWAQAPAGSMTVIRGVDQDGSPLKEYQMGSKSVSHQFCGKCGTHLLGSRFDGVGGNMYNLRAVRDAHFDLWNLPLTMYKGLDRLPAYTLPELADLPGAKEHLDTIPGEGEILVGSCHCQAIKFAVKSEPLESARIVDCACSICLGNGVLWLYPLIRDIFFSPSVPGKPYMVAEGLTTKHTFGKGTNGHYICNTCGCQVFEARHPEDPDSEFGLNVALLNNIGEYLTEAHGLGEDGKQFRGKSQGKLRGLDKTDEDLLAPPYYTLRL